mmetsp:Transcript_7762/g.34515  ORF Transcript_7762/g.34515 Transcript_7762/m.34515 type:complete len:143 (+) Transcript_7762:1227-1655(+)
MFDSDKLIWINGQHLRALPVEELAPMARDHLVDQELLDSSVESDSELSMFIAGMFQGSMSLVNDVATEFQSALGFPVEECISSGEASELLEDDGGFKVIAESILAAYDAGEFPTGSSDDHAAEWKAWVKGIGKETKRKGKVE